MIDRQKSLGHELAINCLPLFFVEFLTNTERAELAMSPLDDARRLSAEQNVDQMARAETLSAAKRA